MEQKNLNENLENICRNYAYVEMRNSPYDKTFKNLKENIENSYRESLNSYENDKKKLNETIKELEKVEFYSNGFISEIKDYFRKDKDEKQKVSELGNKLSENKDKLLSLQKIVEDCYNKYVKVVYNISAGVREAERIIESYNRKKEELENKINEFYKIYSNKDELKRNVNSLLEEKLKKDRGEINNEEREIIIDNLLKKGEEKLRRLSERYLQIKNDSAIAESLLSYKSLVDEYNLLSDSFDVVRDDIIPNITKVNEIIRIFEVITIKEIDFLNDIKLPDNYLEALKKLVAGIEEIDKDFSKRVMQIVFRESSKIRMPELSEITYEMISHVAKSEKGLKD